MQLLNFFRGKLDWHMDRLGIPLVVTDDSVQYLYLTLAELETRAKSLYTDSLGAPLDVSYDIDELDKLNERHYVLVGNFHNGDAREAFGRAMAAWHECWYTYKAQRLGKF